MEYEDLSRMAQIEQAQEMLHANGQERLLRVQLAVEPNPVSNCAVVNEDRDASEVTHHLKVDPSECDAESGVCQCTECHAVMTFDDGEDRAYLKSSVRTKCICPVFEQHDCIPQVKSVEHGAIIVVVTVPSRDEFREIVRDLKAVGASVTVDWLVIGGDDSATAEIDVNSITDKQQTALELALEAGYYETPRQTDLAELAEELDISESAVSQRLNSAETKLVKAFLEE